MKKRFLALALTIAMVGGCLVGCGNDEATTDNTASTDAEQTTEEADTDTDPIQNLISATTGTVELMVWAGEEDQDVTKTMVDSFTAQYPDVDFKIDIGVQSEATAKDTILADVEAAADVFTFADDQTLGLVQAGALQEVATTYTYDVQSSSVQSAIEASTVDGKLYAYPMTADNGYFLYYDKSVISDEQAQSMESLLETCAAAGKKATMQLNSGWYLFSFFKAAGLEVGLADDQKTTTCNWNDAGGTDVAQAIIDMATNDGFDAVSSDEDVMSGIKSGKYAAAVSGTWNAAGITEIWGDNLGATKLPTIKIAGEDKQMWAYAGSKLIGVNPHSKFVGWSMLLAEWLTNKENQILRFNERGYGPANAEALASDEVQATPAIAAIGAQQEFAVPQLVGGNFWTPSETLGKIFADGNKDGTDLQELLDTAVEGITAPVEE